MKLTATELAPAAAIAGIEVRQAAGTDLARWDAFVERCPEATFFHKAGWKEVMDSVFRHRTFYLFAERDGAIVGVLPLAQVKSVLFGHALVSLPFCVYGGVAATDPAAMTALHTAARGLAEGLGADHLELRNRIARELRLAAPGPLRHLPQGDPARRRIEHAAPSPASSGRWCARASSAASRAEIDASVDRFFALYADNVHRHGTPALPKRYFETLKRVFGRDVEILTVLDAERKPVSSVLTFYFRDEVLPYYAGDDVGGTRPGGERLQVLGPDAPGVRAGPARLRLRPQQARHRFIRFQEELGIRSRAAAL